MYNVFDNVSANTIALNNRGSVLQWDRTLKHPDIEFVGGVSTVKLSLFNQGIKAILGDFSFMIGTDVGVWGYTVNTGTTLRVGLALSTRDLASDAPNNDHIYAEYDVDNSTAMKFVLSTSTLTISYRNINHVIDVSAFNGQLMRPWVSDTHGGGGFSIRVSDLREMSFYYDSLGNAVIDTSNSTGGSSPLIIKSGSGGIDLTGVSVKKNGVEINTGGGGGGGTLKDAYDTSGGAAAVTIDNGDLTWEATSTYNHLTNITGTGKWAIQDGGADVLSITGTGVLTSSVPLLVDDVDTVTSGTLAIGKSTATRVEISDTGVATNIRGNLLIDEGVRFSSISVMAGTILSALHHVVVVTNAGVITLPDRATNLGRQYIIINGSPGRVDVTAGGLDLIDTGVTIVPLDGIHDKTVVIASDLNWYTI